MSTTPVNQTPAATPRAPPGNKAAIEKSLIDACEDGDVELVSNLVEVKKANVNCESSLGGTPLWWAAFEGQMEVVEYLVSKGASVNKATSINHGEYTPLHAASSDGHYEVVEYLLQVGALQTVNAKSKDGWTATWKGARGGHFEVVRILVSKGADTNIADNEGLTPLYVAAESGHLQVVQILLDNQADVNQASNGNITPLAAATASSRLAEKPQMAVLLCLLEHGADCNVADSKGRRAIDLARPHIKPFFELTVIDIADPRVMELLSENDYLLWFLMISVDFTSKLVCDLVTEYPELVEVTDTTGIRADRAVSDSNKSSFAKQKMMTKQKSKKSRKKGYLKLDMVTVSTSEVDTRATESDFLKAAKTGDIDEVVRCSMHVKNINCVDGYGWTPLFEAVSEGHINVIHYLVEKGADVNLLDNGTWTPVYLASSYGHLEAVKFLASHGADIEHVCKNGKTPLDVAQNDAIKEFLRTAIAEKEMRKKAVKVMTARTNRRQSCRGSISVFQEILANPSQQHITMSYCTAKSSKPEHVVALTEYLRNGFGYDVWQDDDETLNSEVVDVKDCLENCICMIVCVSKLYMSRLKCKKEVKRAHDLKALKKLRIFYVFMQDDFTNDSHPHHVDGQLAEWMSQSSTQPFPLWDNEHIHQTGDELAKLLGEVGKLESVRTDTARLSTGRLDTGRLGAMVKNTHNMVQQQQQIFSNKIAAQAMQLSQPKFNAGSSMNGHGTAGVTVNGAAGGAVSAVRLLSGKDSPTNAKSPRGSRSPTDSNTLSLPSFGSNSSSTPTVRRSMDEIPVGTHLTPGAAKLSASQSGHGLTNSSMSLDMRLKNKQ